MDFFSKCDQIQSPADLVTFTEEILSGKLHFLCSDPSMKAILRCDLHIYGNILRITFDQTPLV